MPGTQGIKDVTDQPQARLQWDSMGKAQWPGVKAWEGASAAASWDGTWRQPSPPEMQFRRGLEVYLNAEALG